MLIYAKLQSALNLKAMHSRLNKAQTYFHCTYNLELIINKIYREKSIRMTALWCPAFSNHG